jgi:hypothetical protein
LATLASKALELELSGLSGEEADLEMSRRFVRIAATAARQAASSSPDMDEETVVNEALMTALRKHLPSLDLGEFERFGMPGAMQRGRWVRRGRRIVVLGI